MEFIDIQRLFFHITEMVQIHASSADMETIKELLRPG
jgi:hypothetical protein